MLIVIACSLVCLLLTYLESIGKMNNGMKWGFIIITILGCIHYNYGNDYMSYYYIYDNITTTPFSLEAVFNREVYKDPGWSLLCYFFKPFGGFFTMVAVLNIVQNYCVYRFVRNYVPDNWWPLSLFIYLFTTSFYLMSFSMMRQSFVMFISLSLWPLIRDKKILVALPLLFILSFIHQSAIILIPFAFLGFIPFKFSRIYGVVLVISFILLWTNTDLLSRIIDRVSTVDEIDSFFKIYDTNRNRFDASIGYFITQIPFVVILLYLFYQQGSREEVMLLFFASLGCLIMPFNQLIPLVGRVGLYFSSFSIAAIPIAYSYLENVGVRYAFLFPYILIQIYSYVQFFCTSGWYAHYGSFHTIFEVL